MVDETCVRAAESRSYDSGCYELAASFLLDSTCPKGEAFKEHAAELAQIIQDAIESHIDFMGWV